MKKRKCIDEEIPELDNAITLSVYTKVPLKWILIDTETLEVYKGTNNLEIGKQWLKINQMKNFDDFKNQVLKINGKNIF
jgi:hypothetical protein